MAIFYGKSSHFLLKTKEGKSSQMKMMKLEKKKILLLIKWFEIESFQLKDFFQTIFILTFRKFRIIILLLFYAKMMNLSSKINIIGFYFSGLI